MFSPETRLPNERSEAVASVVPSYTLLPERLTDLKVMSAEIVFPIL